MNLHDVLSQYISWKQEVGISFEGGATKLRSFERHVGEILLVDIRKSHVLSYLDFREVAPMTWRDRYSHLRHFFEYCYARRYVSAIPMPENRPASAVTFVPHVYSRNEVRRLLRAIPVVQEGRNISPETLRALVLFLYGTGASLTEALRLQRSGFDFRKKQFVLPSEKFGGSRTIPIGVDMNHIMQTYFNRTLHHPIDARFFATTQGRPISRYTLKRVFQEVREVAKVSKGRGSSSEPTLHDLRHTFAVHRIVAWLKQGADLNVMMPALSVYIGQVGLSSSERYLRLAPERFKKQLALITVDANRPKWGRDRKLMRFLDSL